MSDPNLPIPPEELIRQLETEREEYDLLVRSGEENRKALVRYGKLINELSGLVLATVREVPEARARHRTISLLEKLCPEAMADMTDAQKERLRGRRPPTNTPIVLPADVVAELDPGIRETVRWLNIHGFRTVDSGDGESKPIEQRVFHIPHIVVECRVAAIPETTHRIQRLLKKQGVVFNPTQEEVAAILSGEERQFPSVEGSYNPHDHKAIIIVYNVTDKLLGFVPPEGR